MRAPAPFIVGVGRSGSTLLRLMLDAHPELAIPGETHFLSSLLAQDESDSILRGCVLRTLIEAPTWLNFGISEMALNEAFDEIDSFSVANAIRTFYRLYARRFRKDRWGDKTPTYREHMTTIQRALPEAHFIHIIRDGRDVALSYRGLWFGPGDNIEAQARFWVDQLGLARLQSTELQHYFEIKYEDLVIDPEASLRRVCEYLQLPFHREMLDYHRTAIARLSEHKRPFGPPGTPRDIDQFISIYENTKRPPDVGRIGSWRSKMSNAERHSYEAIAGPLLRDLGYEV